MITLGDNAFLHFFLCNLFNNPSCSLFLRFCGHHLLQLLLSIEIYRRMRNINHWIENFLTDHCNIFNWEYALISNWLIIFMIFIQRIYWCSLRKAILIVLINWISRVFSHWVIKRVMERWLIILYLRWVQYKIFALRWHASWIFFMMFWKLWQFNDTVIIL